MALTDKLTAIADAIRAKTGKTDGLTLAQMPGEIAGIETGSSGSLIEGQTGTAFLGTLVENVVLVGTGVYVEATEPVPTV